MEQFWVYKRCPWCENVFESAMNILGTLGKGVEGSEDVKENF